jgi:Flp pilus assembly secretin CpaC
MAPPPGARRSARRIAAKAGSRGCSMFTRVLLTLAVGLGLAAPALAASDDGVVSVYVDRAKVARLPPGVSTIVVGNPAIADVTMLKSNNVMVITGKGYGETNFILLDAKGEIVDEKKLRVLPATTVLVLQRGTTRASYSCDPECMPTVQLGDDNDVFSKASTQITMRNGLAEGAASASASNNGK